MDKTKYWVKMVNNKPQSTIIPREKRPAGGGWVDITPSLGLCCVYAPLPGPQAPFNFTLTDGATGHIVSNWVANGSDTYKLERATDAGFTAGLTTVQNTSAITANDTVTSGVIYYYRVSGIDNGVQGAFAYATHTAP